MVSIHRELSTSFPWPASYCTHAHKYALVKPQPSQNLLWNDIYHEGNTRHAEVVESLYIGKRREVCIMLLSSWSHVPGFRLNRASIAWRSLREGFRRLTRAVFLRLGLDDEGDSSSSGRARSLCRGVRTPKPGATDPNLHEGKYLWQCLYITTCIRTTWRKSNIEQGTKSPKESGMVELGIEPGVRRLL